MRLVDRLGYGVMWVGFALIEMLHWCSDQWCKAFHSKKDSLKKIDISLDHDIPLKVTYQCYKCSRMWEEEE